MRRGLKRTSGGGGALAIGRFKPIPDEEGTETVLAEAARSLKKLSLLPTNEFRALHAF